MKVSLSLDEYRRRQKEIRKEAFSLWPLYLMLIASIAFLFSLYTLYPFRRALRLNEEFVRDMLHDVNTPLSALRINLKILRKRYGEDRSVQRMDRSIETIESLQSNLRTFLSRQSGKVEAFSLAELLESRLEYFRSLYPSVDFINEADPQLRLFCNRDAFLRIVDNLLSNAGKYNRPEGAVRLSTVGPKLIIEDSGQGIAHPERAFERYYKEGEWGLGLGLHIVRKLCEELKIPIQLESRLGKGTIVRLDLSGVILK